jgi:hypothetical protein
MEELKADFGDWHIECFPEDGARITALKYMNHDLLSSKPPSFRPPEIFTGEFETRPVYGYDDCFPTVDNCEYPRSKIQIRDHGELCWKSWDVVKLENGLQFSVFCEAPETKFARGLIFSGNSVEWHFTVENLSAERIVFLHVMHALLPLSEICGIELPSYETIFDEIRATNTEMKSPEEIGEWLLAFSDGTFGMYLLRGLNEGTIKLKYETGMSLCISFDHRLFQVLGIWWNNNGYPESGIKRDECAFEPIPGTCSDLSKSYNDGKYLSVEPGGELSWKVVWEIA